MSEVTVEEYARILKISPSLLLDQLTGAGVPCDKGLHHLVTEEQKQRLLDKLKIDHGSNKSDNSGSAVTQFTVTREKVSELKVSGQKTVIVKTKQTRKFIKRQPVAEEEAVVEAVAQPVEPIEGIQPVPVAADSVESPFVEAVEPVVPVEDKLSSVQLDAVEAIVPSEEVIFDEQVQAPKEVAKPVVASEKSAPHKTSTKDDDSDDRRGGDKKRRKGGAPARRTETEDFSQGRHRGKKRGKSRRDEDEPKKHGFEKPTQPMIRDVIIPETITVSDLALRMHVKGAEVIRAMIKMGAMATINQVIDQETASLVVSEMGHTPIAQGLETVEDTIKVDHGSESLSRPPIVTIMGHVDHGKTSLLDYIRTTRVAAGEAGGITQHIGAYHVETPRGIVTFLDTPGHAAFSAMRARGAKCTDIAVIVVAGDDGVKPQTVEAIQHAKAAQVPLVIAINKIDKPGIDLDRVKTELSHHEVISEDWGGDAIMVKVSAKTGEGIDELLEAILLQAEVLELKAQVDCPASGVIVESRLDKGRGPVATVLVQNGTLKKGDIVIAGIEYGRVRLLINEAGSPVDSAGPSIPVELLGLSNPPQAGDEIAVVQNERKAREIALFRQGKYRDVKLARQNASKLEGFLERMQEGVVKNLNIVLKADVQGSVEALVDTLEKLSTADVAVKVVGKGVGGINESDVNLAMASSGILIGFNVRADSVARRVVDKEGIELNYYSIIYDVIDAIKSAVTGLTGPKYKEVILGLAEVRDVFRSSKYGAIAGCMVVEGNIKRNRPIRVLRDDVVIYEGALESLRRFKEDAQDVRMGTECGIGVKNYNDVRPGDKIEVFEKVLIVETH